MKKAKQLFAQFMAAHINLHGDSGVSSDEIVDALVAAVVERFDKTSDPPAAKKAAATGEKAKPAKKDEPAAQPE